MKKLISTALVSIIIFNQVMAMDILNKKEENIVRVAAFAAAGDQQKLKAALADGLDSGVSVNEFKEILVQTYAYCGFPRSLNAIGTFMNLLKERGGKDEIGKEPSTLPSGSSLDFGTVPRPTVGSRTLPSNAIRRQTRTRGSSPSATGNTRRRHRADKKIPPSFTAKSPCKIGAVLR